MYFCDRCFEVKPLKMSINKAKWSTNAFSNYIRDYINQAYPIKGIPNVFRLENNHTQNIKKLYSQVNFCEMIQTKYITDQIDNYGFCPLNAIDIYLFECGPKLYKYLDENAAKKNVLNGTIRFKQPSCWNDDFEKLFYQAKYSSIISMDVTNYTPRLNACCFTYQSETNAAWNMYRYNWKETRGRVVCFELNEKKLLIELSKYAKKENSMIYQGYVDYRISADDIKNLYKKSSKYYRIYFENFSLQNYLSLMLLKRNAYSYEQETRFFIIPQNQDVQDELDIPLSLNKVTNRIVLSPNYSKNKMIEFEDLCRSHGFDCDIVISELSRKCPQNVVIETSSF